VHRGHLPKIFTTSKLADDRAGVKICRHAARAANHPVPIRHFLIDSALSHPVCAVSCEKNFRRADERAKDVVSR